MKTNNFNPDLGFNISQGLASGSNTSLGVTDHGLLAGLADDDHSAYALVYGGGEETIFGHGSMGSTETFNLANGNYHYGTLDANCTLTFTAVTGSVFCGATLELTQDGTGGRTITLPASFANKAALEAAQVTTASTVSFLVVWTRNGGTTWYGQWVGAGVVTYATPAIILGAAAAAGAATTVIRSDSTIAAFDATVPTTMAAGDAAATGSVAFAARRDHRHGAPASFGIGEILISDTPSTPLVFADLVQNEAQDDLVYADP